MDSLFVSLLGLVFNRVRGSGITLCRAANDGAFGLTISWMLTANLHPVDYEWLVFACFAVCAAAAMALGAAPGWGRYIGALRGDETEPLIEWAPVDWLIQGVNIHMQLWGFLGLTLRGFYWSAVLCLPLAFAHQAWWLVLPVGLTMGVVYKISFVIAKWFGGNWQGNGLELGEMLFGFVLWGGVGLALT